MSERSVEHATFVVERTYDASPARVFAAWADPAAKASWFAGDDPEGAKLELDFRVGGREINSGAAPDGNIYTFEGATRTSWPTSASSIPTRCCSARRAFRSPWRRSS
jgi:uncharacterized protein YndB with AHSA1/START domain